MPHLIIEYSKSLENSVDIDSLMNQVYYAASESNVMDPIDIKIRAIPYSHFKLADSGDSFVHVTCHMLAGRSRDQKVHLSKLLRQYLTEHLPDVHSISIDIVDMDPDAYKKRLIEVNN